MKLAALCLLIAATAAWAGWREDAGPYITADTGRSVAWLNERVATASSNVVTFTSKPAALVAAEQRHEALLRKIGGSCTNTYAANAALATDYAVAAMAQTNAVGMALVPLIEASYQQLEAAGSRFDPWITEYATTNTVTWPTRYRCQDYALPYPVTEKDLNP